MDPPPIAPGELVSDNPDMLANDSVDDIAIRDLGHNNSNPTGTDFLVDNPTSNLVHPAQDTQTKESTVDRSRRDLLFNQSKVPDTVNEGLISESVIDHRRLPPRLFAMNRYPPKGRINSYSKPDYLLDIVEVLKGSKEFEWLQASCFGRLFKLPIRKSSLSGKLVHQLLSRSLVTRKLHEMWFVFGGHPIRFSLREFRILTGLNCGPYPSADVKLKMQSPAAGQRHFWYTLLGPKKSYTVKEIVEMLKRDHKLPKSERMEGNRRLRLALIVIVEGILLCNSSVVKASKEVVEMVKDLDSFVSYPWGRKSFHRTLEMVKVGKKVSSTNVLAQKLSQSHTATHGFTLAFQLLFLNACPALEAYLPDDEDERTFTDRDVLQLTMLKSFHNSNIFQIEMEPNLDVESIMHSFEEFDISSLSWDDEVDDERVDYIVRKLDNGHIFKGVDWPGGLLPEDKSKEEADTNCPEDKLGPSVKPLKARRPGRNKCKPTRVLNIDDNGGGSSQNDVSSVQRKVDSYTAEEIFKEVDRRNNDHFIKLQQMFFVERRLIKDELFDGFLDFLRSKGVWNSTPIQTNHSDLLAQLSKDAWTKYGDGLPDILTGIQQSKGVDGIDGHGISHSKPPEKNFNDGISGDYDGASSDDRNSRDSNGNSLEEGQSEEREAFVDNIVSGALHPSSGGVNSDHGIPEKDDEADIPEGDNCAEVGAMGDNVHAINDVRTEAGVEVRAVADIVHDMEEHRADPDGQTLPPTREVCQDDDDLGACLSDHQTLTPDGQTLYTTREDSQDDDGLGTSQECLPHPVPVVGTQSEPPEHSTVHDSFESEEEEELQHKPLLKKRRKPVVDHTISPVPPKRARTVPKRYRQSDSSKKKKPLLQESDEYTPFGVVKPALRKKFLGRLASYSQKEYIVGGHSVKKSFFHDILTPTHWVDSPHMEAMLSLLWMNLGQTFVHSRFAVLDTWFTNILCNQYASFQKEKRKSNFPWNSVIKNYVGGAVPSRPSRLRWFTDVDTVYAPMNWGKRHWVALVIQLKEGHILILDPNIINNDDRRLPRLMRPLTDLLPHMIKELLTPDIVDTDVPKTFTYERLVDVYQNERTGDCGPLAVKFIELHAQGLRLDGLTNKMVDDLRMKYAVDIYQQFIVPLT